MYNGFGKLGKYSITKLCHPYKVSAEMSSEVIEQKLKAIETLVQEVRNLLCAPEELTKEPVSERDQFMHLVCSCSRGYLHEFNQSEHPHARGWNVIYDHSRNQHWARHMSYADVSQMDIDKFMEEGEWS